MDAKKKCMNTSFIISTICKNQCLELLSRISVCQSTLMSSFEVSDALTQTTSIARSTKESWHITVDSMTASEADMWCELDDVVLYKHDYRGPNRSGLKNK